MNDLMDDIQEILTKLDILECDHREIMLKLSQGGLVQKTVTRTYQNELEQIKSFMEKIAEEQNFPWFNLGTVRKTLAKQFYIQQQKKLTRILKRLHSEGFIVSNGRNLIRVVPEGERRT